MSRIDSLSNTTSTRAPRSRQGLVLSLACAAMAMVGIDTAIVNVAVPSIQRDLGVTPSASQWVVVAYGLVLGGFLLFGGRLTDHLGRRRIFVSGLGVFTAASFVAGAAQGAGLLIAARAVQGFGAALVAPAALSLLAVTFAEGRERDRAFGIFGAVGGVAGSVGVVASGLLTAGPGWRWAFFINVPVGTLAILLALAFLAADRPQDRDTRLDLSGATTVTGGLLLLVYALHHAANHGLVTGSATGAVRGCRCPPRGVRADRGPVGGAARAGRNLEEPQRRRCEPRRVPGVRRSPLLHLHRLPADAAGPRLLADEDRSRVAQHHHDRVRGCHGRCPAGRTHARAVAADHRSVGRHRRDPVADPGAR